MYVYTYVYVRYLYSDLTVYNDLLHIDCTCIFLHIYVQKSNLNFNLHETSIAYSKNTMVLLCVMDFDANISLFGMAAA